MITLISKFYIKKEDTENIKRNKYGIICAVLGIVINIFLTLIKVICGIITNTISIIADGLNNLSDATSSIVTLLGFKMSNKKADNEHPFGHGRMEYIAGLIVAILIIFMGFELLKTSISKIFTPMDNNSSNIIVYILLVISILAKIYMYIYNKNIAEKISSETLKATAADSLSDIFATSCVLITAVLSKYTNFNIDAICGILVSGFILFTGITTCKDTISPLIGEDVSDETKNKIREIVLKNRRILGIHDLVVHEYGHNKLLVTLHAEVSSKEKLVEIHDVIDGIERELKKELCCITTIHIDHIDLDDEEVYVTMEKLLSNIKENISLEASIHDFRMIFRKTKITLIFDLEVPYNLNMSEEEINSKVKMIAKDMNNKYETILEIDRR